MTGFQVALLGFRMRAACVAAGVFASLAIWPWEAAAEDPAEFDLATGYRISRYQAPVPDDVPGGTRIHFDDVERFVKQGGAILIDVMATDGAGVDPETGRWSLRRGRKNIPGSHWLADVGRGKPGAALEHYFTSNLERLTGGDRSRAIVIYCLADCWMGWNAAKRAAAYGYSAVHWYPEGSDGWRDWDGTMADAEPVAMDPADAKAYRRDLNTDGKSP